MAQHPEGKGLGDFNREIIEIRTPRPSGLFILSPFPAFVGERSGRDAALSWHGAKIN